MKSKYARQRLSDRHGLYPPKKWETWYVVADAFRLSLAIANVSPRRRTRKTCGDYKQETSLVVGMTVASKI